MQEFELAGIGARDGVVVPRIFLGIMGIQRDVEFLVCGGGYGPSSRCGMPL
jgi:hypothetical protein